MANIVIVCVEDEREVLDALVRDLEPFASRFDIEACERADEARQIIRNTLRSGRMVGLVLADHVMPGTTGVELLVELNNDPRTAPTRKVLVTGHAGLADTIKAVNEAGLNHYIAKPWTKEELHEVVKRQLTDFVIAQGLDVLPYLKTLDSVRLMKALRAGPEPQ